MSFKVAIGLEVHVHLKSETKVFCRCPVVGLDDEVVANAASCPICQGHPGVLPAFNPRVAELGLICGLALHCKIQKHSIFERKHYFYPDIPKNFQLTQNKDPIAKNGYLDLRDEEGGVSKRVRVRQVHMEEDAAKNEHDQGLTLVDFNRCGTPLLEIVSEPDMTTPEEAERYLEQLQRVVRWNGLSSANMESGEMRCDANISVRPASLELEASGKWRWELKNLNSASAVRKALEVARDMQAGRLLRSREEPQKVLFQETHGYDADRQTLTLQRSKEGADDYFYFVEPDLRPVVLTDQKIERMREEMRPDLHERQEALLEKGLTWSYVKELTKYPEWYDFLLDANERFDGRLDKLANWMTRDLLKWVKQDLAKNRKNAGIRMSPATFADFVRAVESNQIVSARAGEILEALWDSEESDPLAVAERLGARVQELGGDEIENVVRELAEQNPDQAEKLRAGEAKLVNFFVGQTMRHFQGKANAKQVGETVRRLLED